MKWISYVPYMIYWYIIIKHCAHDMFRYVMLCYNNYRHSVIFLHVYTNKYFIQKIYQKTFTNVSRVTLRKKVRTFVRTLFENSIFKHAKILFLTSNWINFENHIPALSLSTFSRAFNSSLSVFVMLKLFDLKIAK